MLFRSCSKETNKKNLTFYRGILTIPIHHVYYGVCQKSDIFYVFYHCCTMVFCYQNCSDLLWEKFVLVIEKNLWKFEAECQEFVKFLRSLEQFIQTVKLERTIFGNRMLIFQIWSVRTIEIQIIKNTWDSEMYWLDFL